MDMENRQLNIKRIFKAPVNHVWEAWTKPEHIATWWEPNGFNTTINIMDFQKGGEWKLTLHGSDGTNFPNRSVYKEIIPFQKIVFEHFNPNFITTVLFESQGEETLMDWTLFFETAEMFETVVKAHKADERLKQNVEKLANYLKSLNQ